MIGGTTVMNRREQLEHLSVEELWALHETVTATLATKLTAEKSVLEGRLRQLKTERHSQTSERRPYPPVFPKFRNPDDPSQTWAGRGKQPRWLTAKLRSGKKIGEFRI